jgi:peptide/nickel transport system ATP-binding protein
MTPLVELRNVRKVFAAGALGRERKLALDRLCFAIAADRPSVTAVVGESGSGKTTLARLLLGLVRPSEGEVLFQGRRLDRLTAAEGRDFRRQVQAIFQDPYEVYNPFYRVDHVLRTPLRKFRLARSAAEGREQIAAALRAVGLQPGEILGRYPHQLSGGQRQRIMVARALLLRPRLIVADEPVSMVDASLRATILGNLRELHEKLGISLLYITHDLATAYQIADSIVVLYRAAVAEAGDVELVVKTPQHPYTKLLIGSIPRVSTVRDWTARPPPADHGAGSVGCTFADRCPAATARCFAAAPPLFRTAPNRAAACFLYEGAPALAAGDIAPVLAPA